MACRQMNQFSGTFILGYLHLSVRLFTVGGVEGLFVYHAPQAIEK